MIFIADNSSDQGMLFRATRQLLKQRVHVPYSQYDDTKQLAKDMGRFSVQKITDVRTCLENAVLEDGKTEWSTGEVRGRNDIPYTGLSFDEFKPSLQEDAEIDDEIWKEDQCVRSNANSNSDGMS